MILFNGFEIELKKSDFMDENIDEEIDYERIVTDILPELFHSSYMFGQNEQYRKCPICKDVKYEDHEDLAVHIIDEHPEKLTEYANSISEMINHPLDYFIYEGLFGSATCSVCGKRLETELEMNRHMLSHKQYFKNIVKWLQETANWL